MSPILHSSLRAGPKLRFVGGAGDEPLGMLLIAVGLTAWVCIGIAFTDELHRWPFPNALASRMFLKPPESLLERLDCLSAHDGYRRSTLIRYLGLLTSIPFLVACLGSWSWWLGRRRRAGTLAAWAVLGKGLPWVGLATMLLGVGLGLRMLQLDLRGYQSVEGVRIQTELLERSLAEAHRAGLLGSALTGLAAATPLLLQGVLLLGFGLFALRQARVLR